MIKNELARLRVLRLCSVLGNYAILSAVLLLLFGLLPVATFIFFIAALFIFAVVIIIWLITFGQLFSFPDTSMLNASGPVFEWISKTGLACAPYLFAITAVCAAASIIIAVIDRRPHTGRIAASSVALGLAVIGMIMVYCIGGAAV